MLNIQPTGQQLVQQPAAEYASAHSDQGAAGVARTHVPGQRHGPPGVEVQGELVGMTLGCCPVSVLI